MSLKNLKNPQKENKSEEKLQISELVYRRLFETAQDGILILDADSGRITDANPFLKEILGYSQKELLGKELWQIGVFKDIVASKKAFLLLQSKGYIRYKDLPLETKNGKPIDVEFISNTYMVGPQKVIQCNIRDITNRKKSEKAAQEKTHELEVLYKSQEETKKALLNVMEDLESAKNIIELEKAKDEAILASIADGLIAVDNMRKIIMVNEATVSILGWKAKELMGKEITKLPLEDLHGNRIPFNKLPTNIALNRGQTTNVVCYFVKRDKTKFPISIRAKPILLKGKTIGLIELIRDVTNETEVDRAKSEFVSLASHQLRTPLGIMKWHLEAWRNEDFFKKSPTAIRGYFDEVYKSNERVLTLVRDLLSVSRIDQGQVKNVPKSVDVTKLIQEIVSQMQILAHKKKIALFLTIQEQKIPLIHIDVLRFYEVIENLIVNALEYTKSGDTVDVSLQVKDGALFIQIKDTGIGISVSDQKKLFTKFFRTKNAVLANPEGSGLGLYLVKAYVEGWGGKIEVMSVEGEGSTFTISIPIKMNS